MVVMAFFLPVQHRVRKVVDRTGERSGPSHGDGLPEHAEQNQQEDSCLAHGGGVYLQDFRDGPDVRRLVGPWSGLARPLAAAGRRSGHTMSCPAIPMS